MLKQIYKHAKFLLLGSTLSLVLTYIALELLPKALTVLPSYMALLTICISLVVSFAIAARVIYCKSCCK